MNVLLSLSSVYKIISSDSLLEMFACFYAYLFAHMVITINLALLSLTCILYKFQHTTK